MELSRPYYEADATVPAPASTTAATIIAGVLLVAGLCSIASEVTKTMMSLPSDFLTESAERASIASTPNPQVFLAEAYSKSSAR